MKTNSSLRPVIAATGLALGLMLGGAPNPAHGADSKDSYGRLVTGWKHEHEALVQRMSLDWLQGKGQATAGADLARLTRLETALATEAGVRLYLGTVAAGDINAQIAGVARGYLGNADGAVDTASFFTGRAFAVVEDAPQPTKRSFWDRVFGRKTTVTKQGEAAASN